ncbi:protein phosphatase 2C and cyclic nucleotide-binding/kinase domain-containing protein-like [Chenopodium quinoa]|uniref:protein phosphatase 2C and cyclic nucleotide-binding/kinase domain-containing protein-like n=1 Tax=Chenopodium quinoa TaxID=63459 RepID=UPI000B7775EC|nr:protein phosphatase 2C and cyclic nucleotide-binding/kinase domain-containing protein-like [Chenopodium quinoa]
MGCVYSRSCIGQVCIPREARIKQVKNVRGSEIGVYSPAHSEGEDDQIQELNQLSFSRDTEAGIKRLSRVSAQFLPPDGGKTVKVPSENYELRYSFLSQRGYYPDALDKANQDSFCIHTPFGTDPNDHFFGVFDGHGEFGAECSQFVKRKLCENLLRSSRFHVDPVEACHAAFLTTNSQLHADSIDDSMSGTTAITVLVRGRTIYVANAGDSRAVVAQRRGKDLVAVDLSIDQTPFRNDELERVKLSGARVLTLDQIEGLKNPDVQSWGTEEDDDGDPPRLWVQNGMYPGTAFTRSLGDSIAETIGVVANPEIVVMELSPDYPFFVLASDGVFEFLSSQTVVDMVALHKDPRDACAAIVAESYRLWLQFETRTDDITIIVVHVNGLNDVFGGSASPGFTMNSSAPQVLELTGSESPATVSWNSRNQRVRHDVSRARLRAIESSLENGNVWVPSSPSHRKTWEEEAHIERALHDHFLFRKLTDSQCQVLLDCMQRVEVQAGEIVVQQGGEGDCFFVVGSGEFEVFATQEEKHGEVPRVLQRYTAEKLSCFGELALMNNKPLQASVRCVTSGTLWTLKREDFRGILMSEFSNLSSLKLLRSVDLLSRLTILQLSQIASSLSEESFSDGQSIVEQHDCVSALYIIQKGRVRIEFDVDVLTSPNVCSLKCDCSIQSDLKHGNRRMLVEKSEGSYFGEWALFGEQISQLAVCAVGDVVCSVLTKDQFDLVAGPLTKISLGDQKSKEIPVVLGEEYERNARPLVPNRVQLSDLEWRRCLYSTDCSEIGLVLLKDSENFLSLKRFLKQKVKRLGKEDQVLKEKNLMKSLSDSVCVPHVIGTCADETHVGILLDTCLACPLASILNKPLDESSARFCAASVAIALEELHKKGILFRGVSPEVLMCDQAGRLQLVDFRFGKQLSGERTNTICGMADSLSPEIVLGKGHGFPADWWGLGVLIYFMLQGEMPFGSWRENELDTVARIAKGHFNFSQSCSSEAIDLITKLLEVDETKRLGNNGSDSVKNHQWFEGVDWEGLVNRTVPVPHEIVSRISHHLESYVCDTSPPPSSPRRNFEELNTPEWLEDW